MENDVFTVENDVQAISELACRSVKKYRKPCKYPPDKEGLQLFQERTEQYFDYIRHCNEDIQGKPMCADIESWACSLGITRKTIAEYQRNRSSEWASYIEYVKGAIFGMKKSFADSGRIPPMTFVFDAVNNFSYFNTNSFVPKQVEERQVMKRGLSLSDLVSLKELSDNERGTSN